MNKNIFVLGDLVIDHTVFVKSRPERPHQPISTEMVYEVVFRQDDPGGAANSARMLAAINEGLTFLWGIVGKSPWGDFRSILVNSTRSNFFKHDIELRGIVDNTGAQMNTITRIVAINEKNNQTEHKVRFDDYGQSHITDIDRSSALYYIKRAHEKYGLDVILINDLDYGSLTKEIIEQIAEYATNNTRSPISLIIDPKRTKAKYENIKAFAIMPNLSEWCYLVNDTTAINEDVVA